MRKLYSYNWKKIGKGALIAGGGAAISYVLEVLMKTDFGNWSPVVTALAAVTINAVRVKMADNRY